MFDFRSDPDPDPYPEPDPDPDPSSRKRIRGSGSGSASKLYGSETLIESIIFSYFTLVLLRLSIFWPALKPFPMKNIMVKFFCDDRYSNVFRQRIVVTLSVLVAWYFSFLIIFILPLDVSSTVYR